MRRLLSTVPLLAVAAAATALAGAGGGQPRAQETGPLAPSSWRGLVGGPRPAVATGQRVLVVLEAPSLAERVARAGGLATDVQERRWTAAAFAAQQDLLTRLAARGILVRPEHRFTRVLNGFSAALDPGAVSVLERARQVRGVYPVRVAYPASLPRAFLREAALAGKPQVGLAGDGRGVLIALLDTGVEPSTPYLHGHVLDGIDVVSGGIDAHARPRPEGARELERHGTLMAGILVGAGGIGGVSGVAPEATLLPIRVAGWQPDAAGRWVVYARTDQILAGLERAVDPNGNGDAHDAARVALVPLVEPFAAFADGPLARAAAGALALDTLVVVPAGNDGPAGPAFGSVSGPGGSPAALTVGAADARGQTREVSLLLRAGLEVLAWRTVALAGAVATRRETRLELAVPPADPGRPLGRLFDEDGKSLVAGRAALVPVGASPARAAQAAAAAGAAAVLLYGSDLPAGGLGLDESVAVPVLSVPSELARAARRALQRGEPLEVAIGPARSREEPARAHVASFSSWGLAFDGGPKPELLAPGVGITTVEPGARAGRSRFLTVNGSSAAAAVAAGAAALLVRARPSLTAAEVKSLLVGTARRLPGEPLAAQGAGLLDAGLAAAAEIAVEPAALAFGRGGADGWNPSRTLLVRNLSSRALAVYVSTPRRKRPRVLLEIEPRKLELEPGAQARVRVRARVVGFARGSAAGGLITLTPVGGVPLRVPWGAAITPGGVDLLGSTELSASSFKPSRAASSVLTLEAGQVRRTAAGPSVEPVLQLDIELERGDGRRMGLLARLRDLLPGRYAFGLTGRAPSGRVLEPGRYRLRLVARPVGGGRPTVRAVTVRIE